jgi:hypothetical protein
MRMLTLRRAETQHSSTPYELGDTLRAASGLHDLTSAEGPRRHSPSPLPKARAMGGLRRQTQLPIVPDSTELGWHVEAEVLLICLTK